MTTLKKMSKAAIELATYEPRNKLLAIYIKSILNGPFFFFFLRYSLCTTWDPQDHLGLELQPYNVAHRPNPFV